MLDCLPGTGSTGVDLLPIIIALLVVGIGVAVVACARRKRGAGLLALAPLALGLALFGGATASPAQAASCETPPAAECVPTETDVFVHEGPRYGIGGGGAVPVMLETHTLGGDPVADAALFAALDARSADLAAATITVTFTGDVGTIEYELTNFSYDPHGYVVADFLVQPDPLDQTVIWNEITAAAGPVTVAEVRISWTDPATCHTDSIVMLGEWRYPAV